MYIHTCKRALFWSAGRDVGGRREGGGCGLDMDGYDRQTPFLLLLHIGEDARGEEGRGGCV